MKVNKATGAGMHEKIYHAATELGAVVESIVLTPEEWKVWTRFLLHMGMSDAKKVARGVIYVRGIPVRREE